MSSETNVMMELFRAEVENHSETLTTSLMALERDPSDASILECIMRSAHSLKGAARIVGVNAAVEVAHIMEDCLVAAQRGELSITPSDVDALLKGVDLLVQISEATKTDDAQWTPIENEVQDCVLQLKSIRAGQPTDRRQNSESIQVPTNELPASPEIQAAIDFSPKVIPAKTTATLAGNDVEPVILTFGKTLDRLHAEEMRLALLAALKSGAESVRYDLAETTDLDPIGLAFLAASKKQVHELGLKSLEFNPVSEEIRLVLRMTGISSP